MIITLVGYRGTGKSSIAPVLAARLGSRWVDADVEIERRADCSIRDIFSRQGEPEFRRIEREVISELLREDSLVLAAGGGAVLDADTRRELQNSGPVIWLQASVDTILSRMQSDSTSRERRPSLTDNDARTEVESLLSLREPLYDDVATLVLETDGRTPDEIVEEIVNRLSPQPNREPA